MTRPHQATKFTDNEFTIRDHGTPRTSTSSPLLSLPLEVRLMIFVAYIKPSRIKDESRYYFYEPIWYLSHTIPRSTLRLNKQLRIEALTVLAGDPGLTVMFNVWPSNGLCSNLRANAYPPTIENTHIITINTWHDFGRAYQQCKSLPAPKGRKLTLRLHDIYGPSFLPLEDARKWLADHVFVAVEFWPKWESVFIDVDGMNDLMMNDRKSWMPSRVAELEILWNSAVEDLQPLRAKTRTMKVGLKGWLEDTILMKLEKGEGSGQI